MRKILYLFYHIRPVWQFSILVFFTLVILFLNPSRQLYPIRAVSGTLLESFSSILHYVQTNKQLKSENEKLKKELIRQIFWKNFYQNLFFENVRLKKLLELKQSPNFDFIFTRVIGLSPYKGLQAFIVDKGENDSIRVNDPVISSRGLVGRVVDVQAGQAIVQLLLDRNIKVAAKIVRNDERGILEYYDQNLLVLNYIPKTIRIVPGDLVVTSETSQVYPEGIRIGKVVEVSQSPTAHFQKIFVEPFVNFSNLTEVVIIKENYEQ
jgi:rod shape-determining protein MreC